MQIHIKYTDFEPNDEFKEFLVKKLAFLSKLRLPKESAHAWVEVGRARRHHKEGKVWYAECQLRLPGKKSFRATSTNYDLGSALEEVKDDLELIINKTRDRYQGKIRRERKRK